MGNGINKVLPDLYLGNFKDARDREQLARSNITHILSIHESAAPILPVRCSLFSTDNLQAFSWIHKTMHLKLAMGHLAQWGNKCSCRDQLVDSSQRQPTDQSDQKCSTDHCRSSS
ncbi:hypothetical protein ILYODFUR_030023 [Ilyodon furcidens]|uniref:Uncharacterized protein n=1 Tax=Ilyodon furcidens TaxID=33524 RepID=A0ABV0TQW1_9TELE